MNAAVETILVIGRLSLRGSTGIGAAELTLGALGAEHDRLRLILRVVPPVEEYSYVSNAGSRCPGAAVTVGRAVRARVP